MKRFIDGLPYGLVVAICAAVAPLLVMLLMGAMEVRALVVVPGMMLVLGFFAAVIILKIKSLRWSATFSEMMSAIRAEGAADNWSNGSSGPQILEYTNGKFAKTVSLRDFNSLNRPHITRMLMIDWLTGVLGWSLAFYLFSDKSLGLTVTLAGLLTVHIARIRWLIRQRHLALTFHQSIATIALGVVACAVIVPLSYVSSALNLLGWWEVYRNAVLALALLSCFLVYADIAIASIIRKFQK